MANIVYTVNQDSPESIPGFEQYSQEDKALVSSFQINSAFDPGKNYSELHILSLSDELLESVYEYTNYTQLGNAQSAGHDGASILTIDPIADVKAYGYENGGVKLLYHFLDDLYTTDKSTVEFFIQDISQDRTEVVLSTLNLAAEILNSTTQQIKSNLQNQSYFTGFRLNFRNNDLFIATNIDTLDIGTEKVVVVKLYEPLPTSYTAKSTLNIVDIVSDSIAYEVDSSFIIEAEPAATLRSPNFNIEVVDESVIPTEYYNYDELFSYPVNNANSQIYSTVNKKGIDISVDYTDFNDFVHFSSAQERLLNFKYKLDLVSNYSASISSIATTTTGLQGVSGSRAYYENLITGIVSNFDHYENFLYYESGSSSWPKSNSTKPYINKISTDPESITWFTEQISNAITYDQTNYNSLIYSIPTYLRDDTNNDNYLTFVYMVGQHFDNLWLYSKAVTDKYDADNRVDKGISKDLVAEALKNFGVKLYTSNKSTEDLFTTFIGQSYQSGSELINHYITGSLTGSNTPIQPTSYDSYQKEVQKRIYHNLPLLLKSKGTERGVRALINCLGIPADTLSIKLYGGRDMQTTPFFGDLQYCTSSLGKIRLDNTGSIVSGDTLSMYTSIAKRDHKYTDDLHTVELGFSPTDNIDKYIISHSADTFNIDEYIGDPNNLTSTSYLGLSTVAEQLLGSLEQYNLQDYVRLIKFFDNTVFKVVKDFLPARSVDVAGIIIKPNLLNRSKAKSVTVTGTRPEYTASIDTAFIGGTHGGSFGLTSGELGTIYTDIVQTPQGLALNPALHSKNQAKYDGEFARSVIKVSNGELNRNNSLKITTVVPESTLITPVIDSLAGVCTLTPTVNLRTITNNASPYNIGQDINGVVTTAIHVSSSTINIKPIYTAYPFPDTNYLDIPVTASNPDILDCTTYVKYTTQYCDISTQGNIPTFIVQGSQINLTSWFTSGRNTNVAYTASYGIGPTEVGIPNPSTYIFNQPVDTPVTIKLKDNIISTCFRTRQTTVVAAIPTPVLQDVYFNFYYYSDNYSTQGQYGFRYIYNGTVSSYLLDESYQYEYSYQTPITYGPFSVPQGATVEVFNFTERPNADILTSLTIRAFDIGTTIPFISVNNLYNSSQLETEFPMRNNTITIEAIVSHITSDGLST